MFDATRFKTLMLREWLQNRWTWLIAIAALPVLTLVSLPFGEIQMQQPGKAPDLPQLHAAVLLIPLALTPLTCVTIAWLTTLFMASGLARRDWQDRSIEFWLSLPSTHGEHIGAQYLMHGFVFPLLAMLMGLGFGLLLLPVAMAKFGLGFGELPWGMVASVLVQPLLLAVPALFFGALWMAPVVLTVMAASVWLKRLALPILVVIGVFLGVYPGTRAPVREFVQDYVSCIGRLFEGLAGVLAHRSDNLVEMGRSEGLKTTDAAGFLAQSLGDFASLPALVGVIVTALACTAIVAKRRRG